MRIQIFFSESFIPFFRSSNAVFAQAWPWKRTTTAIRPRIILQPQKTRLY